MKYIGAALFIVGLLTHLIDFPGGVYWEENKIKFMVTGAIVFGVSYVPHVVMTILLALAAINLLVGFFTVGFLKVLPTSLIIVALGFIFTLTCRRVSIYRTDLRDSSGRLTGTYTEEERRE